MDTFEQPMTTHRIARFGHLMHNAHATTTQFLKDMVVRNRNPEERVRSRHSSASHLR